MSDDSSDELRQADLHGDSSFCLCPYRADLPRVVDAILGRLRSRGTMQHVCHFPLPSQRVVIRILELLAEVLFPGYFGKKGLDQANLPYHLGETLNAAYDLLAQEITRCLLHEHHEPDAASRAECQQDGCRQAFLLVEKLPELLSTLDDDIRAAHAGDPAATGFDEVIFCYPGFRAIMIYRIAHELHQQGVQWLPRIMTEYAHRITGIDIHPGASVGKSFFIDHGTGVVIGETTQIGDNVRMYQGVTLGGFRFRRDADGALLRNYKRHPTIEDDVIIYANASVLGPITVGAGSTIGANVILTESVPPGTHVTIEPPRQRVRQHDVGSADS